MKYVCKIVGVLLIIFSSALGFATIRLCISSPSVPAFVVAIPLLLVCLMLIIAALEFMKASKWKDISEILRNLANAISYFGELDMFMVQ